MHSTEYAHVTGIKTAGSAVRRASRLAVHPNEELWPRRWILRYYPYTKDSYWAANVRHPALRAISAHRFHRRFKGKSSDFDRDSFLDSFSAFNPSVPSLLNIIGDPDDYDAILKVETLAKDWEPIAERFGFDPVRAVNVAPSSSFDLIDSEILDACYLKFSEDYAAFGYEREPNREPDLARVQEALDSSPQLKHLWNELHGKVTADEEWMRKWLGELPTNCDCRKKARGIIARHPVRFDDFLNWGYEFHDLVNKSLGKPAFGFA